MKTPEIWSYLIHLGYNMWLDKYSAIARPGDIIAVRERSKSLEVVQDSLSRGSNKYSWIEFDSEKCAGKYLNYPERTEIPETINEQLIVELYSK